MSTPILGLLVIGIFLAVGLPLISWLATRRIYPKIYLQYRGIPWLYKALWPSFFGELRVQSKRQKTVTCGSSVNVTVDEEGKPTIWLSPIKFIPLRMYVLNRAMTDATAQYVWSGYSRLEIPVDDIAKGDALKNGFKVPGLMDGVEIHILEKPEGIVIVSENSLTP